MNESIIQVADSTFEEQVLKSDSPVMVDYWAEWCGPCKMIAPILDEIADEYSGKLTIAKLNIDENQETPQKYAVRGIPTLMIWLASKNAAVFPVPVCAGPAISSPARINGKVAA